MSIILVDAIIKRTPNVVWVQMAKTLTQEICDSFIKGNYNPLKCTGDNIDNTKNSDDETRSAKEVILDIFVHFLKDNFLNDDDPGLTKSFRNNFKDEFIADFLTKSKHPMASLLKNDFINLCVFNKILKQNQNTTDNFKKNIVYNVFSEEINGALVNTEVSPKKKAKQVIQSIKDKYKPNPKRNSEQVVVHEMAGGGGGDANPDIAKIAAKVVANQDDQQNTPIVAEAIPVATPVADSTLATLKEVSILDLIQALQSKNMTLDLKDLPMTTEVHLNEGIGQLFKNGANSGSSGMGGILGVNSGSSGMGGIPGVNSGSSGMGGIPGENIIGMNEDMIRAGADGLHKFGSQMLDANKTNQAILEKGMNKFTEVSSEMIGMNMGAIDMLTSQFPTTDNLATTIVGEIFNNFSAADGKKSYENIRQDIYSKFMDALRDHLTGPEGRQLVLRQIEPFVSSCIEDMVDNNIVAVVTMIHLITKVSNITSLMENALSEYFEKHENTNNSEKTNLDKLINITIEKVKEAMDQNNPLYKLYETMHGMGYDYSEILQKTGNDYNKTLCSKYEPVEDNHSDSKNETQKKSVNNDDNNGGSFGPDTNSQVSTMVNPEGKVDGLSVATQVNAVPFGIKSLVGRGGNRNVTLKRNHRKTAKKIS